MKKSALFLALTLLGACSKNIQTTEAVRQGILDDLQLRKDKTGVDPSMLVVTVSSVSFDKDQARANVSFTPKSTPGGGSMTMSYVLDRDGNKWVVKGREVGAANPHGAERVPEAGTEQPGTAQPGTAQPGTR